MTTEITHHCSECGDEVSEYCPEHPRAIVDSIPHSDSDSDSAPRWSYEGYWNVVLSSNRNAADVIAEFDLDPSDRRGLDEWLGHAEEAAREAGGLPQIPEEWAGYHARALAALEGVAP